MAMFQTTTILMVAAAFSAIGTVHGAECLDGECPSEVLQKTGRVAGSSFIQATTGTAKMAAVSTLEEDPFGELEDSFDTPASGLSNSASGVALLSKSDFWFRCVQDVVIFAALFMLVPLAAGVLFEGRSRLAKRGTQAPVENIDPRVPPQQRAAVNFVTLMEAARSGDEARWRPLVETIPNVARAEDLFGSTALHVAASAPCAEMAAALVEQRGADVNAKDTWEETPLHFAARAGSVDICALLLANGADLNALSSDDTTPLLVAAKAGKEATCQLLLDQGASCGDAVDSELPPLLTSLLLYNVASGRAVDEENVAVS